MNWGMLASAALPSFLASLVEFVEALTIVLAVGVTRGWRSALLGVVAGVASLALMIAIFGPALTRVPINILQLVIGVLLILFGLRWLRKAILRAAGAVALHDEERIFERNRAALAETGAPEAFDSTGFLVSFKAVVLEGLEVVFIVIALGATAGALVPASLGAACAGVIVVGLGLALSAPLSRVPENALKFVVGVMLSAFGTFWTGEGIGVLWPGADWSILALVIAYLVLALVTTQIARERRKSMAPA